MTTVHVNRSLKRLRDDGLIRSGKRSVIIEDWDGLQAAGEFDPTYLHLRIRCLEPGMRFWADPWR
jgi:hypothetical protein